MSSVAKFRLTPEMKKEVKVTVAAVAAAALDQVSSSPHMRGSLTEEQRKGILRQLTVAVDLLLEMGETGGSPGQLAGILTAKMLGVMQIADLGDREACAVAVGLLATSLARSAPSLPLLAAGGPVGWALIAVQAVDLLNEAFSAQKVCRAALPKDVPPFSPSLERGGNSLRSLRTP